MSRLLAPTVFVSLVAAAAGANAGVRVYESHFDKGAGAEWSSRVTGHAPAGPRTFLGPFVDDGATLTVTKLPAHRYVRVSFDLLIIMSWDGNGERTNGGDVVGPDHWRLSLADGPTLLWHTFSNTPDDAGFADECKLQTYPSPVVGASLPANTGAAETNTMGYVMNAGPGFPMDATYHVTLTIPHDATDVALDFRAYGLQRPSKNRERFDEAWGADRVVVETLAAEEVNPPTLEQARALLDRAAGSEDPVKADEAYVRLLLGGPGVRQAIEEAFKAAHRDDAAIRKLVKSLVSDNAAERTAANGDLLRLSGLAEPALWDQVRAGPPAARDAAMKVLYFLPAPGTPEHRRGCVAARVLEAIGPARP